MTTHTARGTLKLVLYPPVLLVEVVHVRHQVLDHVHVGQRVDLGDLAVILDLGEAGQGVDTSHGSILNMAGYSAL